MAERIIFTDTDINNFIVDCPKKAYSLGFLWGDGHLKSFKHVDGSTSDVHYPYLGIVKEDFDCIKEIFNIWGEWKCKYRKRENRREQGEMINFNRNFGWFLTKYDYLHKSKMEPSKILSIIPEYLHKYWWRGFIDADGCFYYNKKASQLSISGSFEIKWQEFEKILLSLNINKYQKQYRDHKKSKSSCIRISNKNDIIKLGDYIYYDNLSLGLKRKYDKFIKIKNK